MIGYVTLGTNDIDKARDFYAQLFAEIGVVEMMKSDDARGFTMYGNSTTGQPLLAVTRPYDGKSATAGNGSMLALSAEDNEAVGKLHAKALKLGGTDEGAPGFRGPGGEAGFYGAYFRDLDGNKLCVFNYKFG